MLRNRSPSTLQTFKMQYDQFKTDGSVQTGDAKGLGCCEEHRVEVSDGLDLLAGDKLIACYPVGHKIVGSEVGGV